MLPILKISRVKLDRFKVSQEFLPMPNNTIEMLTQELERGIGIPTDFYYQQDYYDDCPRISST